MQILTPDFKQLLYDLLADAYILAVEKYQLGKMERKVLATKLLSSVEMAQSVDQLLFFLEPVIKTYPVFSNVKEILKGKKQQEKERAIIKKIEQVLATTSN